MGEGRNPGDAYRAICDAIRKEFDKSLPMDKWHPGYHSYGDRCYGAEIAIAHIIAEVERRARHWRQHPDRECESLAHELEDLLAWGKEGGDGRLRYTPH